MKYTLLSWALVAFSALLTTALGSSDGRYMVVHNVNIAFDKSRRDIALVGFNVYNVLQGESFTCVTTKMPYYPMTPDFVGVSLSSFQTFTFQPLSFFSLRHS